MIPPPPFGPLMATPRISTFPVQFVTCPDCGNSYGVVRPDLIKPHVFVHTDCTEMKQCLGCFPAELFYIHRECRRQFYELHFQFSAAAG